MSTSYDPLELYRLIERVILKQTEDQYLLPRYTSKTLRYLTPSKGVCRTPSGMNVLIRGMTLHVLSEWNLDTKCCGNNAPSWLIQRAMTRLGQASKPQSDRQRKIDILHIFFSSTAARRTNSCERSYKTTSRRVVTNTLRTALKLCYFWTDTRSQSQRMEDRMGQHSPRRQGKQKRTMQRRHQMTQKAESRNSIKNTSRTSLVSNVGKRAIRSPTAHRRTVMMIIHPSQASPAEAAILGGSQKSRTLKISSRA